ncbi:MAG: hypothetical protein ACTSSF_06340, partial [Candidatus Heimdallarchaeaceae archaeon]
TLNQFMQRWISKYNLTYPGYSLQDNLMSTPELLQELNDFSGLNFTEDFQKYVYGIERIPIYEITYEDIEPLVWINDSVVLEDNLEPLISIVSPRKDETFSSPNVVVKWSIYENSKLEEVNVFLNDSLTQMSDPNFVQKQFYNLTSGRYILKITAKDEKGNLGSKTVHFNIAVDTKQTDAIYILGITSIIILSILSKRKKDDLGRKKII